ncbi:MULTISPECIES: polysaccharide deacetylase family protein [unclassified Nocardioides]|uniref:polysaccharide deacetylase family protein n=1 Tax=unclassified Nocardioides TaxID=2615069 RepID=UPI0000571682|nr:MULTISPECIES: polysaccharide deacetylase family protein [unclassified Nocardioides]ABL81064.1 polysaccharide deacetylase [Nocardioides sp. JS614]
MSSRLQAALGVGALTVAAGPAVTAIGPLRQRWMRRLSGISSRPHIALTFDDGPDPVSTPAFLELLAERQRQATFFVLGSQAVAHPALVQRIIQEGHELAIHGWIHRCTLTVPPARLTRELRDAQRAVEDITNTAVSWYRPPYGVLNTEALLACRNLDLTPVLWTAWGREWERSATPTTIVATVTRTLRPGGTILLHDTDLHAPHGDWRHTLHATERLLGGPLASAAVGPLRDHWSSGSCENLST